MQSNEALIKLIKSVVVYLRKSRGDEDVDLLTHKRILTSLCKANDWVYVIKQEIGDSDSIESREVFTRVLEEIENDYYDAIAVVDMDRISRNLEDSARAKRIIADSGTYIITPEKIYDLSNESDDMHTDFSSFIGSMEYKMIKKRLRRGKIEKALMGYFVNGRAPIGYIYNSETKKLEIDPSRFELIREIFDMALTGEFSCRTISQILNRKGVKTNNNLPFSGKSINCILKNETYLGRSIYGKTKGDGHKKKNSRKSKVVLNDRNDWLVVENAYPNIITEDEFNRICYIYQQRRIGNYKPSRAKLNVSSLQNIVVCGQCGKKHPVRYAENIKKYEVRACGHLDYLGVRCNNRGVYVDEIEKYIIKNIQLATEELKIDMENQLNKKKDNDKALSKLIHANDVIKVELKKANGATNKVKELLEEGIYSKSEYIEAKLKWDKRAQDLTIQSNELLIQIKGYTSTTIADRFKEVCELCELLNSNLTPEERNIIYKRNGIFITWTRIGDDEPIIEISYA